MRFILFDILDALRRNKIYYSLSQQRYDSIMITATFVGARIEIDVFDDNHIEFSFFKGDEFVDDNINKLYDIIKKENN